MWAEIFNKESIGILVFAYLLKYKEDEKHFEEIFTFKRNKYGLVAIEIEEYLNNSKPRSKSGEGKFNAISVSRKKLSEFVKPISYFLK